MNIIPPVFAADIPIGPIEGVGLFQQVTDPTKANTGFGTLISTLIGTLTVVGGLAFLLFFILGAIKWITSGGDKNKISESQGQMINALIGLIVITVAYFIVGIVGGVLGVDILNPIKTLKLN